MRTFRVLAALALIAAPAQSDNKTRLWTPVGLMSTARAHAAAVTLPDGRVLITGGDNSSGPVASAEIYEDGSFIEAAPMSVARSHHTATVLRDGRVLVAGGKTSDGQPTWSAEVYDPIKNSWTQVRDMAKARTQHTATLLTNGRVAIAGGETVGGVTDTIEYFFPGGFFVTSPVVLTAPRRNHSAVLTHRSQLLFIGGDDGRTALASIDVLDTLSDAISAGPEMTTPRTRHTATVMLGGDVLILGGTDGNRELTTAEVLDVERLTVSRTKGGLARPRADHVAVRLPNNNTILVAGGTTDGKPVQWVEQYRSWADAGSLRLVDRLRFWSSPFTSAASMSESRAGAAAVALADSGEVLMIGGVGQRTAEKYSFAQLRTDRHQYPAGKPVSVSGAGWRPGEAVLLKFSVQPRSRDDVEIRVTADENGRFTASALGDQQTNASVYVTAMGPTEQAQTAAYSEGSAAGGGGQAETCDPTVECNADNNECTEDICQGPEGGPFTCVPGSPKPGTTPCTHPTSNCPGFCGDLGDNDASNDGVCQAPATCGQPPASTPVQTTGGGQYGTGAARRTFGFNAKPQSSSKRGEFNWVRHSDKCSVNGPVTQVAGAGNEAEFKGECKEGASTCTFTVKVRDNPEPAKDQISVDIKLKCAETGTEVTIQSGNIQVKQQ